MKKYWTPVTKPFILLVLYYSTQAEKLETKVSELGGSELLKLMF